MTLISKTTISKTIRDLKGLLRDKDHTNDLNIKDQTRTFLPGLVCVLNGRKGHRKSVRKRTLCHCDWLRNMAYVYNASGSGKSWIGKMAIGWLVVFLWLRLRLGNIIGDWAIGWLVRLRLGLGNKCLVGLSFLGIGK